MSHVGVRELKNHLSRYLKRVQGGEEILVGASPAGDGNGTRVTGSTYLFDQQVARFFATLPPAAEVVS